MLILAALAIVHATLFAAASRAILRSHGTTAEKRRQLAFALFVPFAGPVLAYGILKSDHQLGPGVDPGRSPFSSVEESPYVGLGHDRPDD